MISFFVKSGKIPLTIQRGNCLNSRKDHKKNFLFTPKSSDFKIFCKVFFYKIDIKKFNSLKTAYFLEIFVPKFPIFIRL